MDNSEPRHDGGRDGRAEDPQQLPPLVIQLLESSTETVRRTLLDHWKAATEEERAQILALHEQPESARVMLFLEPDSRAELRGALEELVKSDGPADPELVETIIDLATTLERTGLQALTDDPIGLLKSKWDRDALEGQRGAPLAVPLLLSNLAYESAGRLGDMGSWHDDPERDGYGLEKLRELARQKLDCVAAGQLPGSDKPRFKMVDFFAHRTAPRFLARDLATGTLYVVVRGTAAAADFMSDLKAWTVRDGRGAGRIHAGFQSAFEAKLERVREAVGRALGAAGPGSSVVFCGHSLGGAVALLHALEHARTAGRKARLVTFGMPRPGDAALQARVADQLEHTRVRFGRDAIPNVPPGYALHLGDCVRLKALGHVLAQRGVGQAELEETDTGGRWRETWTSALEFVSLFPHHRLSSYAAGLIDHTELERLLKEKEKQRV